VSSQLKGSTKQKRSTPQSEDEIDLYASRKYADAQDVSPELRRDGQRDKLHSGNEDLRKSSRNSNPDTLRSNMDNGKKDPETSDKDGVNGWKKLSQSLNDGQLTDGVKKIKSRRKTDVSDGDKDQWKQLSKSVKVANDLRRSQTQHKRRSAGDVSRSRTRGSSQSGREKQADNLRRSRTLGSSDDELWKSKRSSADDLTRSRTRGSTDNSSRYETDDRLRKSKRRNSGDLTRSRTMGS